MGTFSIWHWLIVLAVVLVLFGGKGKISALMGDFGKGLKSFKKGMKEDSDDDDDEIAKEEEPKALKSESTAASENTQTKDQVANS